MMSPFLQIRLWWRRANPAAQLSSTTAVVIVVGLLAWLLLPTGSDSDASPTSVSATGTPAGSGSVTANAPTTVPGATATPGPAVAGAAGAPGGSTAGGVSASGATANGGQPCPAAPSGSPGVDDKSVLIGVGVLNLAGPIGNQTVGVASAEDFEKFFDFVIADVNSRGGMACRQVKVKYYETSPINPDQQRAACIQAGQDKIVFFLDLGAFVYPQSAYLCMSEQKIPIMTAVPILPEEMKYAPYLWSTGATTALMMHAYVKGLNQVGYFDPAKGFKKLGLLMDQCGPGVNASLVDELARIGIKGDKVSTFEFECPSGGFAPPNEMQQAISQFRLAGVTHVIPLTGSGSFKPFTSIAQGQGFKPVYGVSDYQGLDLTSAQGSLAANPDNFDGAIMITNLSIGENTSGFAPSADTKRCQAYMAKAGYDPTTIYTGGLSGVCSYVWLAQAALAHATALTRDQSLQGLFRAGTIHLAAAPDVTFRPTNKIFGGDTWWPGTFHKDCTCYKVPSPQRYPSV